MHPDVYERQLQAFIPATAQQRPEFANAFVRHPVLDEDTPSTPFDSHYLYHVAWALRKVLARSPAHHVDFSSSLSFCAALSAHVPTTFFDFRPAELHLDGLSTRACDLSDPALDVGQHDSVSCMHVVEHIGLGRYGDRLDVNGDLQAIANLKRSVLPGGELLFAVPAGAPSVHFNAHRVYAVQSVLDYFSDAFDLLELYFIPGPSRLAPMLNPAPAETLRYPYGCACFQLRKRSVTFQPVVKS